MDRIYRRFAGAFAVTAIAVCVCISPTIALGRSARSPVAGMARACHNHAGKVEGDGEYTDGAILSAVGISCGQALTLVKPRYHWIYAHFRQAYQHGFQLGAFSCRITPDGPDDLKSCVHADQHFAFI
jgi:hypothetical protein